MFRQNDKMRRFLTEEQRTIISSEPGHQQLLSSEVLSHLRSGSRFSLDWPTNSPAHSSRGSISPSPDCRCGGCGGPGRRTGGGGGGGG